MVEYNQHNLSEEEAALYDRQIRLWGLDAQKRLRAAKVLVAGGCGLGAEIIKNLVLAGVKSLKILDHQNVSDLDTANFLAPYDSIGKNIAESSLERSQILNPMVEVSADSQNIENLEEDYFKQFDIVCVCKCTREQITRINNICRKLNILFYAGDVYGMHGFSFADLIDHKYVEEVKETKAETKGGEEKKVSDETKMIKKIENFVPFSVALDIDWTSKKYGSRLRRTTPSLFIMQIMQEFEFLHNRRPNPSLRQEDEVELLTIKHSLFDKMGIPQEKLDKSFVDYIFGQLSPVCAIVGGVLSQEIIKAVSQKDTPLNNFFFFSSDDCAGVVESLGY